MYIVMIVVPKRRMWAAVAAALIFVVSGIIKPAEVPGAINWNVILMILGTMFVVYYFIESGMPNLIADILMEKTSSVLWFTVALSLFSGIVSAFIDNVATVLMIAPIGIAACKKYKLDPVLMTISIAVSSNLQGAATLVGDTTSIMLGAYAKMDFLDFFFMHGKPGIFFAVELGALLTVPVMVFIFRKNRDKIEISDKTYVEEYWPTVMLILLVAILIGASFFKGKPEVTNGVICVFLAAVSFLIDTMKNGEGRRVNEALKKTDYETLILLLGIFIVVGGITSAGIIDDLSNIIVKAGGSNLFVLYSIIVWGSVLISAFIDNIPYVATMLPVITGIAAMMNIEPYVLYFGLLCGATLGGNITPIGASANITGIGLLNKEGYNVSFGDFAKVGIPFTLVACAAGYLFIWLVWG